MNGLLYGYAYSGTKVVLDIPKAKVVGMIYNVYLSGLSISGISKLLHEKQISSPSGKERWSTAVLSDILSDNRYLHLVGFDKYLMVQDERNKRSTFDLDTGKRKAARYHSKNVLSGLFVCAECGRNYRRVQRASGEMVWRCANRVEHGSIICKSSPTITEEEAICFVCKTLGIPELDPQAVREGLESITVHRDGSLTPELKPTIPSMAALR